VRDVGCHEAQAAPDWCTAQIALRQPGHGKSPCDHRGLQSNFAAHFKSAVSLTDGTVYAVWRGRWHGDREQTFSVGTGKNSCGMPSWQRHTHEVE